MSHLILVVDDDADIRDSLSDLLLDEGFRVLTACNGKEGLEKLFLGAKPDLIILDLMMPVMDGWSFLKVMRNYLTLDSVPVVVLTAFGDLSIIYEDHVLVEKPLSCEKLFVQIERSLSGNQKSLM